MARFAIPLPGRGRAEVYPWLCPPAWSFVDGHGHGHGAPTALPWPCNEAWRQVGRDAFFGSLEKSGKEVVCGARRATAGGQWAPVSRRSKHTRCWWCPVTYVFAEFALKLYNAHTCAIAEVHAVETYQNGCVATQPNSARTYNFTTAFTRLDATCGSWEKESETAARNA